MNQWYVVHNVCKQNGFCLRLKTHPDEVHIANPFFVEQFLFETTQVMVDTVLLSVHSTTVAIVIQIITWQGQTVSGG